MNTTLTVLALNKLHDLIVIVEEMEIVASCNNLGGLIGLLEKAEEKLEELQREQQTTEEDQQ